MTDALRDDLLELARAARILAREGHEDMTLGHVALRDPDGRGAWMKRQGISLGETRDAEDFVLVGWDGRVLSGDGRRHGEWPLHTEVFRARPDLTHSLHSHPDYATLLTGDGSDLVKFTQDGLRLGDAPLPFFEETADLVTTPESGAAVADALGESNIVMMRNHGCCVYGDSVAALALTGVFLERAARAFIRARSAGLSPRPPDQGDAAQVIGSLGNAGFVSDNWSFLKRDLARSGDPDPGLV